MYESKQVDFNKLNQSSAPPATGVPVGPGNQYYQPQPQPPPPGHPIQLGAANQVPWSTGLCDCTQDVPNCCITCWCPCIPFGQISEIVDRGSSACAVNGAIYALLAYFTGCACIYSCMYRAKIRNQYNLTEGPCNDCLLHCCCECCALCQEYRELQHQGYNMSIGWQGNVERQNQGVAMAPAAQPGMYR